MEFISTPENGDFIIVSQVIECEEVLTETPTALVEVAPVKPSGFFDSVMSKLTGAPLP
jgi:hypothetical protein